MSQKNCEVWKVSPEGAPISCIWSGFNPEEAWAAWNATLTGKDRIAAVVSEWPNLGHLDATRTEKFSMGVSKFAAVLAQGKLQGEKKAFEQAKFRLEAVQAREVRMWQDFFNEVEKVEAQVKIRANAGDSLRHEPIPLAATLFGKQVYRCVLCDQVSFSSEIPKEPKCYVAKDSICTTDGYCSLITQLNKLSILRPFKWDIHHGFFSIQGQILPRRREITACLRKMWGNPYASERKGTDLYFELNFDTAILFQFDQYERNYLQVSLTEYGIR